MKRRERKRSSTLPAASKDKELDIRLGKGAILDYQFDYLTMKPFDHETIGRERKRSSTVSAASKDKDDLPAKEVFLSALHPTPCYVLTL